MSLKAGIWASRLGFGPQGWDLGLKAGIWALRLRSESEEVTWEEATWEAATWAAATWKAATWEQNFQQA